MNNPPFNRTHLPLVIDKITTRKILQGNCSSISELDVRLLNHQNRTSIAQVMVHFSGLLQLRLFNGLCLYFGTVRGLVF